ncbi:MAG: helix-turn-helix domain-containing protein [Patescibacteria group bacterium]|nr:helix-turn-helix domain-containing protein [Patescibacteria group bacterium]
MDIKDLHRQGYSIRQIAQLTGHTRRTITRKLSERSPEPFSTPARSSHLDPFKPYLEHSADASISTDGAKGDRQ